MSNYCRSTYTPIREFGNKNAPCIGNSNHPLTMCMADTMDKSFQNGGIASLYGPRSRKCQDYMGQRCAENWDGFCEYFYKEHGADGQWPNNREWPNAQPREWEAKFGLATNLTSGDQLLRNTVERKYCTFPNCRPICEPFNPTDPDSPMITYYVGPDGSSYSCIPTCSVDPSLVDSDPVMDRMLSNPRATAGTLINICNTSKNMGVSLSGTKLGNVCDQYFKNMRQ